MSTDLSGPTKRSLHEPSISTLSAPEAAIANMDERATNDDSNPAKRLKTERLCGLDLPPRPESSKKGIALLKPEYLIEASDDKPDLIGGDASAAGKDDDAEAAHHQQRGAHDGKSKKNKQKGQNTGRHFGSSRDAIPLCASRAKSNEFSPTTCPYGDKCKFEHDLRKYLKEGKRLDLDTFNETCPVFDARGTCPAGWRCRFAKAHSRERPTEDGRSELVLISKEASTESNGEETTEEGFGVVNVVSLTDKVALRKRQRSTPKADTYNEWLNKYFHDVGNNPKSTENGGVEGMSDAIDNRAQYVEPPFLPSEKRRIYYGPETPVLAPLTTQGNLPYRRLCVELGAQITWSEMAMSLPLIQGEKAEWALLKAHESELASPKYTPKHSPILGYDNQRDTKFGAQISGNKPWVTLKATEVITSLCPHLRAVDLNCGCPIDLVYKQGAGSALLDTPGKLEKILRGMNTVSGEVPITVKIRMGTKDNHPTATRLVSRLAYGGPEATDAGIGPAGVAAVTLHGRSRQQRYTRSADWAYISECASIIDAYNSNNSALVDTIREPDERYLSNGKSGKIYFIGNGDCYSHLDYYEHIDSGKVDSVMVARGALIKPWIFEEIEKGQYLDKSSTERLQYVEKFARYGMEAWGSDEIGLGLTRRFMLEWLSFACRYVPVGLLEHRPDIQDRPPAYRGRNDLETLMSSENYRDWIKISEMFLGPAHKDFRFEPKHRSNNRDGDANLQAEG